MIIDAIRYRKTPSHSWAFLNERSQWPTPTVKATIQWYWNRGYDVSYFDYDRKGWVNTYQTRVK